MFRYALLREGIAGWGLNSSEESSSSAGFTNSITGSM